MKDMKKYRVKPGQRVHLDDVDPNDKGHFNDQEAVLEETEELIRRLDTLQERLYAESKRSLLVILQALDSGGKMGPFAML